MAVNKTKLGVVFIFIITVVESQITSSLVAQTVCVGDDVELDWVYGNAADSSSVTWSHTNSSSNTKTIMQLGLGGGAPTVIDNFNVVHKSNGGITLTNVNEGNSGSYKISVTYLSTSPVEDSVSVTVKDCSTTTTTTSTTSTTSSSSTATTTTPASTTMTTSSTTTTPPTKMTTPSTTTTTPASTISTMPITTTSMRIPITTSAPPTTSTTLTSNSTSSTKSSNDGLSDEMIIVIVIVPVGVIAIVGTVIFVCLFYRLQRSKRKPASHERQGRHYKGNIRSVQQHQQQPYILYGRGHARELNHKETKRSRSLHYDDRYNLYNAYHWGSQVKQNPMYKGDRNLSRLYYNESLPRYDDNMSGYTTGHIYPSHTSQYQYRPEYHGDSRQHGNRQHCSYPVYSRHQEYINPSYSYMGY